MKLPTRLTLCAALAAVAAAPAFGAFHLWRVSEMYTNSTGQVQFLEMFTTFSGQQFMTGHTIKCTNAANTQSHTFTFPNNSCTPTNNHFFLMATASFSAQSGSVSPDYIIPDGFLFPEGGSIDFGPSQQVFTYGPLPTDGVNALKATGFSTVGPYSFTSATNSPTNCAGSAGSINVPPPPCVGDINGDHQRNTSDLTAMLGAFGSCIGGPGYLAAADLDSSGCINTSDLVGLLAVFGVPCP